VSIFPHFNGLQWCFPNAFSLANTFWFQKTTTDPHILAQVNIVCPDDRYRKRKNYSSELILVSYSYTPVALRNNAWHDLRLIKMIVFRFACTLGFLIEYCNGRKK